MPVVDVPSGVTTAVKQQDRRVGAKAADPFADDRARVHRDLDSVAAARLADRADIDALVESPVGWRQHHRHRSDREHPSARAGRPTSNRAAASGDVLALVDPPSQRHCGDDTDNPAHGAQSRGGLERRCGLLGVRTEHAVRRRPDPDRGQPPLQCLHVAPVIPLTQHPAERRWRVTDPAVLTDPRLECRRGPGADNAGHGMQAGCGLKARCGLPRVRPEHPVGGRRSPNRGQPALQRLHVASMFALTEHSSERRAGRRPPRRDERRRSQPAHDHHRGREQHRGAPPVRPRAPCASSIGE